MVTDGLWGALFSGGVALLLFWLQSRSQRDKLRDAWQGQAEELRDELRKSHEEALADKDRIIRYLQGQASAKDVENARLVSQLGKALHRGGSSD